MNSVYGVKVPVFFSVFDSVFECTVLLPPKNVMVSGYYAVSNNTTVA